MSATCSYFGLKRIFSAYNRIAVSLGVSTEAIVSCKSRWKSFRDIHALQRGPAETENNAEDVYEGDRRVGCALIVRVIMEKFA